MSLEQRSLFEADRDIAQFKRTGRTTHGGEKSRGKRKTKRPVIIRKWHHVILKSDKAKGELSLSLGARKIWIEKLIRKKAIQFGLVLGGFVNVGNHLHLKLKPLSEGSLKKFLKSVTGLIARRITGAKRGRRFGSFWDGLAFSRVLRSSAEELYLRGYFEANRIQKDRGYQARETFLKEFRAWVKTIRKKKAYLIAPAASAPPSSLF